MKIFMENGAGIDVYLQMMRGCSKLKRRARIVSEEKKTPRMSHFMGGFVRENTTADSEAKESESNLCFRVLERVYVNLLERSIDRFNTKPNMNRFRKFSSIYLFPF